MEIFDEINKFWNWFDMTPEKYPLSKSNGEYETEYPNWKNIYGATESAISLLNIKYDENISECLIQALAVDNESEYILNIISSKLKPIEEFSKQVIKSNQDQARWQLAEILGYKNEKYSSKLLIDLIRKDKDIYVQRRALLSLQKIDINLAKVECLKFTESKDLIFKRIALGIIQK